MGISEELNTGMYFVCLKTNSIFDIYCTHESKSGNTVLTDDGRILRTDTKHQKIFHNFDFARLAVKQNQGQTDDAEYAEIIKKLNLRKAA